MIILLAILVGPFVYGIVYGIRHRDSGAPKDEGTLEAPSMMQSLKGLVRHTLRRKGLLIPRGQDDPRG